MEVRLAFYKAQMNTATDFCIAGWTGLFNWFTPAYSHVEIGFEINDKWVYFSSSIRDKGTRWKENLLTHPERWDVYTDDYEEKQVERMIERAHSIEGKKYDFWGILGFLTPTGQFANDKDKYYCSEACFYVLTALWEKRISPRRLSRRIKDNFKLI